MTDLYYECHITIDPVEGDALEIVQKIAKGEGFRVAELIKRDGAPYQGDTFMTARASDYGVLERRMQNVIRWMKQYNFVVRRYKIEDTLLDSKIEDKLGLLV